MIYYCILPLGHEGPHEKLSEVGDHAEYCGQPVPPPILPDDDTAVERLEAAIISAWPYDTDIGADPRLARKSAISLRNALREGGQR